MEEEYKVVLTWTDNRGHDPNILKLTWTTCLVSANTRVLSCTMRALGLRTEVHWPRRQRNKEADHLVNGVFAGAAKCSEHQEDFPLMFELGQVPQMHRQRAKDFLEVDRGEEQEARQSHRKSCRRPIHGRELCGCVSRRSATITLLFRLCCELRMVRCAWCGTGNFGV